MRVGERTQDLARVAVVDLFRSELEWRRSFGKSCQTGAERLRGFGLQVRDELAERGRRFKLEEVEDVLLALAREKLPESHAALWDAEWASGLCREALQRLAEHYEGLTQDERVQLDLEAQDEHHDRMNVAGEENAPAAFREALAGWERAGVEAFEDARRKKGAVA